MSTSTTATDRSKLTPPQLAKRWGVAAETVITWIRSGEFRAIDVSSKPGIGRPRYRVDVADLAAFEARRQVVTPPKRMRRRRQPQGVVEYF